MLRFICSGLVQYSFFEALRRRLMQDLAIPAHRDAAMNNLSNAQNILFREDPLGAAAAYIHDVQSRRLDIADPIPQNVLDLLKTALPADFNNSCNLEWRYMVREGIVWKIGEAPGDYVPQSRDEEAVLDLLSMECCDRDDQARFADDSGSHQ